MSLNNLIHILLDKINTIEHYCCLFNLTNYCIDCLFENQIYLNYPVGQYIIVFSINVNNI